MSIRRHAATLASRTTAASTTLTGTSYIVLPNEASPADHDAAYAAAFEFVTTGGTSPTLDAKLQTSWDGGTTWHDVVSMTQMTTATTFNEVKKVDVPFGPVLRAVVTPGGGAAPNFTGTVRLLSNDAFRVIE